MDEGMEECGQRQQGVGWEQLNSTALVQLLCLQLPAVGPAAGLRFLSSLLPQVVHGVGSLFLSQSPPSQDNRGGAFL